MSSLDTEKNLGKTELEARETDPLLNHRGGVIRARRSSKSPVSLQNQHFRSPMSHEGDVYEAIDDQGPPQPVKPEVPTGAPAEDSSVYSEQSGTLNSRRSYRGDHRSVESNTQPPILEIPEEIYAVRKAALQVLKPLTKTWVRGCFQ